MFKNRDFSWLRSWETLLTVILVVVIIVNMQLSPFYLGVDNLVNVFHLSIEKLLVALIMTLIIINAEIDLSVASLMGLGASLFAWLFQLGVPTPLAIVATLAVGALAGAFNGFWVAYVGLPSLAVTLAGLVGYRGAARIFLEDESVSGFPAWFTRLGQDAFLGPVPLTLLLFALLFIVFAVILRFSAFGRYVYIIGNNLEAARFAGVKVRRVKMTLFSASGLLSVFAGIAWAARIGSVRANAAEGFELDIITMVLLGGVNIFGGAGTLLGVGLSLLVVLNLRNGMTLANINGSIQTSVIGLLLILSVLLPNLAQDVSRMYRRLNPSNRVRTAEKEVVPTSESSED